MAGCYYDQNTKRSTDDLTDTNVFDCELEGERSDFNYDADCGEEEDEYSRSEASVYKAFVDGNATDFNTCEDEDTLFERVWWLSKPPKISRRTCVVPARKIQVIKERLSSTVNGLPIRCGAMPDQETKNSKRRKHAISDVEYVMMNNSFNEGKRASCQGETINIIPACARTLDELL